MSASDIKSALVVGAGVMGHAIAQVFAQAGIKVTLVDTNTDILSTVRQRITSNLETLAEFGHVKADDIDAICDRVKTTENMEAAAKDADFVVEAVSEVPEVKKAIFEKLEGLVSDRWRGARPRSMPKALLGQAKASGSTLATTDRGRRLS